MGKIMQFFGLESASPSAYQTGLEYKVESLEESSRVNMGSLELARDNVGYRSLIQEATQEFSREGLLQAAQLGRVMGVGNPLIKRGRNLMHAYTFGQGFTISATDEDINNFVLGFLDDEGNRAALFGAAASARYSGTLFDEGNFLLAAFTDPLDGRVRIRVIDFEQIGDKITAPGDRSTTHFYLRSWTSRELQESGSYLTVNHQAYHPDIKYQPATRFKSIDGVEVMWDAPILHVMVNENQGWKYGIGDSYAAIPWALAHKRFLEDWSLLMQALAKIAYVTSSKNGGEAQAKRQALRGISELTPGSTVSMTDDQKLEPLSKSGATLDSESSRPLATMAASAMGIPVTLLLADPGQTGARATAETLDLPTRLGMQARQELHSEVFKDLIEYAMEQAVMAPRGALRGKGVRLRDGDRLRIQWTNPEDSRVEVSWPSLDEVDVKVVMDAIVAADGLADVPKLPLIRLALQVLKVENIEDLIANITDQNGDLIPSAVSAGDVAVKAFRDGQDPASAIA